MAELGFKHFVGVDDSQGMLDQAARTGLYQDLRLASLGTEPLPAQSGTTVILLNQYRQPQHFISVCLTLIHSSPPGPGAPFSFYCVSSFYVNVS